MTRAVLLAAGLGTRIAQASCGRPKVLLKAGGSPVLFHNLRLLKAHGVGEVWINLHRGGREIRRSAGRGRRWGLDVRYSPEERLLGTAGALAPLRRRLRRGDFFVIYGDNWTDCDLSAMMRRHRRSRRLATIAVFHAKRNPNSGIAGGRLTLGRGGSVKDFKEGPARSPWVNAGIYVFRPDIFRHIPPPPCDFARDVFPRILPRLGAYKMKGFCYALDTPRAYRAARSAPRPS